MSAPVCAPRFAVCARRSVVARLVDFPEEVIAPCPKSKKLAAV